jgi:Family of unknown function (DUF6599)
MRTSWSRGVAAVLAVLSLAASGPARPPAGHQETLRAFLPADGAVPGWSRDGEAQVFVGEDLFTYIDGGAEIYREYGFSRVVVQDYKSAAGTSISLEVFEMASPAAAYGMFTFKRSGRGRTLPLGSGAELEDYYLNLWRGRYLATLTGFDASAKTVEGLEALAAAVAKGLGEAAAEPSLVAALPGEGLRPQSVKYLKGLLGLNNIYPFHTGRGLDFVEAVKGDYPDGALLLILEYASAPAGEAAWSELGAFLKSSDRFTAEPSGGSGDVAIFRDGQGRFLGLTRSAGRIIAAVGADPAAAAGLARRAIGRSA